MQINETRQKQRENERDRDGFFTRRPIQSKYHITSIKTASKVEKAEKYIKMLAHNRKYEWQMAKEEKKTLWCELQYRPVEWYNFSHAPFEFYVMFWFWVYSFCSIASNVSNANLKLHANPVSRKDVFSPRLYFIEKWLASGRERESLCH